jgi:OmpA-OmpF porin, OOP family
MRQFVLMAFVSTIAAGLPARAQTVKTPDQIAHDLGIAPPAAGQNAAPQAEPTEGVAGWGTAGIRLGKMAPAPTSRQPCRVAASANHGGTQHSSSLQVRFANASAELLATDREQLDNLGKAIAGSCIHLRIEGHTDTVGDTRTNMTLSQRRAAAVAAYLKAHYGISTDRLRPVGLGEEGLAVPTPDQTPEPANRRVVVVNLDS